MKTSVERSKVTMQHDQCYFFSVSVPRFRVSKFPSLAFPSSTGDTLLAIRAPIGTQLEVPIPEAVSHAITYLSQTHLVLFSFKCVTQVCPCPSRSLMDKGNTRFDWRVHPVPLRSCWSTRTHPVPLLLFCRSLLQMTSSRASQHRHPPPCSPLRPHRSSHITSFLCNWSGLCF